MPAAPEEANNARVGMVFFVVYLLLYGGFVGLCALDADAMKLPAVAGVNLAIVYGIGLIVAAFVLALGYVWVCRTAAKLGDGA